MLKHDIEYLNKVIDIKDINDLYDDFFCWLYPFTNENIDAYFKTINFKNKTVLTVTSSGDHILNSLVYGTRTIDAFDSNVLAKYFSELKIAAIKTLSLEEFIKFFYNKNIVFKSNNYMSNKIYEKVRPSLYGNYEEFWNYVFNNFSHKEITKSFLFTDDYLTLKRLIKVNKYLNNESYYQLRNILGEVNINYFDKSFNDLKELNNKYDIVLLSNILAFFDFEKDKNKLLEIKDVINNIVKDDSEIVLSYLYATSFDSYADEGIYNKNIINKHFISEGYKYLYFTSSDVVNYPKRLIKILNKKDYIIKK